MLHSYLKRRAMVPAASDPSWRPVDICRAYQWPTNLVGGGQIAIPELGGAYLQSDTEAFCAANNIPIPTVTHIYLDGAAQTNMQDQASGEVALDIQTAAASYSVATGKVAQITIFWANSIQNALLAATTAKFDVFSSSWGDRENQWCGPALDALEQAATAATSGGMICLAASGDNDSGDGGTRANVDAPASAPHFLGCGGTHLAHGPPGVIITESVWNDGPGDGTGGGFSTHYAVQPWQLGALPGPGRLVPDMAANAAPTVGYRIWLNGQEEIFGGTSAVAPLYAGLFASFGTKLGWVGPTLWSNPGCFHDVITGNNGLYHARVGPDACTGLGSPHGAKLAALFGAMHNP